MGNANGCICRYGWCIRPDNSNRCKENHTSTPKIKPHKRNLSAAFNLAEQDKEFNVGLLNINTATEEELMTLPGVNRQTAHNIVDYRAKIGAFKRVEDLALVSGVGATKLETLRLEICVSKNKTSQNSSTVDLSIQDNVSRSSSKSHSNRGNMPLSYPKVNVNTSNVFQFMKVKGISQQLGENIVAYRDKKGHFRSLDDLIRVKGMKPLLSAIRPHLVLSDDELSCGTDPSANGFFITSHLNESLTGAENSSNGAQSGQPANVSLSVLGSQEDLVSLYGPIARKSMRHKKRPFFFKKDGQSVLRLATWNLQHCNEEKTENPGVREVFAMTVLENGFSIIAIQDVRDKKALPKLCDELNRPTVPNVKKWQGHQGLWKCVTSDAIIGSSAKTGVEYLGFLYDSSRGIEISNITVLSKCNSKNKTFSSKPAVAVFKVSGVWELVCVNVHLEPLPSIQEDHVMLGTTMLDIMEAVEDYLPGEKDIVVMGDFGASPDEDIFSGMREQEYHNMLDSHAYTNTSTHNPEGTACTQNIWLGSQIRRLYTENSDVVREGLTSPWIPDGWGWGGVISHHCPLYTELYLPSHMAGGDRNANSLEAIKLTLPMSGAGDS